jgi:hypothetical protein
MRDKPATPGEPTWVDVFGIASLSQRNASACEVVWVGR